VAVLRVHGEDRGRAGSRALAPHLTDTTARPSAPHPRHLTGSLEVEHLGPGAQTEPPKVLDQRQIQGLHSGLRSRRGRSRASSTAIAHTDNGLARSVTVDKRQPMRAGLLVTSLRVLTWCCVILLAILSLLPDQQMVRTRLPGRVEHFVAYAGSAAIAVAGYGASRGGMQIIGGFWVYAGILEYLQHFSPGRHPSIADFAASALGALCGGLAIALLLRRVFVWPC
jgi:VanZ family protein